MGTKVIRGDLVMVNHMCQPGQATAPICVVKVCPGCFCESILDEFLHLHWRTLGEPGVSP